MAMKAWAEKVALSAAIVKTDNPALLAAAACTDDVMKATLAQRKELNALRAAIDECKTVATQDAYRSRPAGT